MSIIDKVKEGVHTAVSATRDGVEEMKAKRDLAQAYEDFGCRAVDLMDAGKLESTELAFDVERIRVLRAEVAAAESAAPAAPAATH